MVVLACAAAFECDTFLGERELSRMVFIAFSFSTLPLVSFRDLLVLFFCYGERSLDWVYEVRNISTYVRIAKHYVWRVFEIALNF